MAQDKIPYQTSEQIKAYLQTERDNWKHQIAACKYSFIGDYKHALASWDHAFGPNETQLTAAQEAKFISSLPFPAQEYIWRKAVNEQIIIINEAHHQPLHRVFTASLLQGLYDTGFHFLGLEALAEDSIINQQKTPLLTSGFYIQEPQFANLLREALRIGFTLFAYEVEGEDGHEREVGQAINIKKILEKYPDAKILIHCGFDHVMKGNYPNWGKTMAGRLKEQTGIDPFTIDQVELTEHSKTVYESPWYKLCKLTYPTVFVDLNGYPFCISSNEFKPDLSVAHPRTNFIAGRPYWLYRQGKWKGYTLKPNQLTLPLPFIAAAYPIAEDPEQCVPMDMIEISDKNSHHTLVLPTGKFIISIFNKTVHQHFTITIDRR